MFLGVGGIILCFWCFCKDVVGGVDMDGCWKFWILCYYFYEWRVGVVVVGFGWVVFGMGFLWNFFFFFVV